MRRQVEYLVVCAIACASILGGALDIVRAQGALPAPWLAADIGAPSPAGTSSFSNGRFTVSVGGVDVWDTTDQLRFVYQQVSGDVDIVARVDSLAAVDPWSKAGIMIRADLSASSAHAYALVSGAQGVAFQRRPQGGGISSSTAGENAAAPRWVRLKRVGTVVTGYSSADGGTWQTIASATIALGQSAFVGFAVTSHNPGSAATAVFSQSAVNMASASPTLPSGQQTQDVGAPAVAGSASYALGVYTLSGAGADIWGSSDQFRFVYQAITGDVDIAVRVASLAYADEWTKAGVMVRESLDANSRYAMALISAGQGSAFQWRLDTGGLANSVWGGPGSTPTWVRLVRTGFRFEAFRSTNGSSWTSMGVETVSMADTVYVGLAVTSHNPSRAATAVFDHAVSSASAPPALPSGQQTQDVGAPAVAGSASYAQGVYMLSGAGADIWNTADQFRFVYQAITGDVDIAVRIASVDYADEWTKAGLMVRESLDANSRFAMALVSAGQGSAFQWRLDTGGWADSVWGGPGSAPTWVRLVRTGFRFEAFRSTNGTAWTSVGVETVPMNDPVYVGLAVTSHNASRAAMAVFDHLAMTSAMPPSDRPPTVSLTSPAQGATFTAPAAINLTATASDPENQLARVEFYRSGTLISSDTTAPFTATWSSAPAGTYSLTAVAVDAAGNRTTSAAVSVTVNGTSTGPRLIVFHASSDDATLVTSYRFDVFASGANPSTATPVATSDLGKPAPDAAGDITVNRASFFAALAPGTYLATVSAIGNGGAGRSAPITFVR